MKDSKWSTAIAKLKVVSLEERIHSWKEHFKNLLWKSPNVTEEPITKIIKNQQDIKLEQFTQDERDVVQTKIKNRTVDVLMKYHQKYGKQENSTTLQRRV